MAERQINGLFNLAGRMLSVQAQNANEFANPATIGVKAGTKCPKNAGMKCPLFAG